MRIHRPKKGGWACMHAKTLVLDASVVLTGSANLTHNGLENNKEHLWRLHDQHGYAREAVMNHRLDFGELWSQSRVVGPREIKEMMRLDALREEKRKKEKQAPNKRSQSLPRSRSEGYVVRNLAFELNQADERDRKVD